MSLQHHEDVDVDDLTNIVSDTPGKTYNLEDVEGQARWPASKFGELSTKNKWEKTVFSASFWNMMIVISCVIAISLDPLFFYIPFIDEEKKCLGMDKRLRNVALILRSLTDITFLVRIGYQIYEGINKAYKVINQGKEQWELDWQVTLIRREEIIPFAVILARELNWCSLVIDLLSVFPMPQLLILSMRARGYLEWRKVVNFFLLSQYLPRICRIILSSKKLKRTTEIQVIALFNLFLYFLASHVIGAFWYFFSIQREISCWYHAFKKEPSHEGHITFYCDDRKNVTTIITLFNKSCSLDVPDDITPPFNYGIFLDALKIGNSTNVDFPTKLCYSFWWGLRNLSNFGTNLTTSSYVWENVFAILISVIGLLLFLYLIGNVQMRIKKSEKRKQKIKLKVQEMETWVASRTWKCNVPDVMMKEIKKNIREKLEDEDANLENLFNLLPRYTKTHLKQILYHDILSQVQRHIRINEAELIMMCDYLTPVTYPADKIIFKTGDPISRMLFIIEGTVRASGASPSTATSKLEKGNVYGEELLTSLRKSDRFEKLPTSTETVRCDTKVEGFVLSAKDLKSVVLK